MLKKAKIKISNNLRGKIFKFLLVLRYLLGAILKYEYNAKSMLELNQNIWAWNFIVCTHLIRLSVYTKITTHTIRWRGQRRNEIIPFTKNNFFEWLIIYSLYWTNSHKNVIYVNCNNIWKENNHNTIVTRIFSRISK